jgi:serine/threonine-protein kinase RsbW
MLIETGSIALSISGGLHDVRLLGVSVRAVARTLVSAEQAAIVELCTVEIANNCIEHAYRDTGCGTIDVKVSADATSLVVEIRDSGRAIEAGRLARGEDPFEFDPADIDALPEGGMGLALVRASAQRLEYSRENGSNVTRIFFARTADVSASEQA